MTVGLAPLLETYPRADVTFEWGEGCWLVSSDGRNYLDFCGGIAVVGLGHRHQAPLAAAREQLDRLWHVSNLYWTRPMADLASALSSRFGGAQAFFCNSGAEAVEAAIKYAHKATGKNEIVALEGSFHGRTTGALAVTGQPAKRAAFEPLRPGVSFARLNDIPSLHEAVTSTTGLILLELVQGEGGVQPAAPDFVEAATTLAAELGALLCFDEVQTGVGRTGTFFAFEQIGIKPDLVTLAKGLANGLPIGCLLVANESAGAFAAGDHASTFGGNPTPCAAACAVVDALDGELLAHVHLVGEQLFAGLTRLPHVHEVRGRGLLIGAELDCPAGPVVDACLDAGLLVSSAGANVLRLTPPLVIEEQEVEAGLAILKEVLSA
jgi:acetylornithine/N-succinyldiaminopimelate aminotransferase